MLSNTLCKWRIAIKLNSVRNNAMSLQSNTILLPDKHSETKACSLFHKGRAGKCWKDAKGKVPPC